MAISHVIGFDDAPFAREYRGEVLVVGAMYAGLRLEGVLSGHVQRDGGDATETLIRMLQASKFADHLQLIMLQGIAVAGFNVIDVEALRRSVGLPVLVIARNAPDLGGIQKALMEHVEDGKRKWELIEQLPVMEPLAGIYVQRFGLSRGQAEEVVLQTAVHGNIPEPVRAAHLIAGGIELGESRGRV